MSTTVDFHINGLGVAAIGICISNMSHALVVKVIGGRGGSKASQGSSDDGRATHREGVTCMW